MESRSQRRTLVEALFPSGIPRLWCPTLTHFSARGNLDEQRIGRHLEVLAPYARGILVPGSTGEGWELDETEIRQLLDIVLHAAPGLDLKILIGVLRGELDQILAVIQKTVDWLCNETGRSSPMAAMNAAHVVGFTVCPPWGASATQRQIGDALTAVLELGHPTALYQLPQVTHNEMGPECVLELASSYPNFYLFKDTSGEDRVAKAALDLQGVFLVRGAEGGYCRWPKSGGGPYDGFLLSSANCFARELARLQDLLATGQADEAAELSDRIENTILECFEVVREFPHANPFTCANKALDHVMAFGGDCFRHVPPCVRGGHPLAPDFIEKAHALLSQNGLVPERGYLE